jgi:FMN hydrolase / 5-amino-6-(5-phospho-D-ribitylamino)uracil phosphatase
VHAWAGAAHYRVMLRALCLDLMGTLVHDPYREALVAATGLDVERLRPLRDPDAWPAFEIGAIDEAEFARRFFTEPDGDHRFDLAAFNRARHAGYAFLPGMDALLEDTAGVVERYVASNYPVWVEELAQRFGLHERTEGVWSSHHLGVRKPDPRFFARLLERIGHAASDCLFVDDRDDNCVAAAEAGMRTHRFTGAAELRARLRADGLPV